VKNIPKRPYRHTSLDPVPFSSACFSFASYWKRFSLRKRPLKSLFSQKMFSPTPPQNSGPVQKRAKPSSYLLSAFLPPFPFPHQRGRGVFNNLCLDFKTAFFLVSWMSVSPFFPPRWPLVCVRFLYKEVYRLLLLSGKSPPQPIFSFL